MQNYDDFEGPSDEELTAAYRKHNQRRLDEIKRSQGGSIQTNLPRLLGIPRRAKHRGQRIGGVRIH